MVSIVVAVAALAIIGLLFAVYVFGGHGGGPSCAATHSRMYRLAPISEGRHLSP